MRIRTHSDNFPCLSSSFFSLQVLLMASQLATSIGYSLSIALNIQETTEQPETAVRSKQAEREKEAKIRNKTARAALRAKSKEEQAVTDSAEPEPEKQQTN